MITSNINQVKACKSLKDQQKDSDSEKKIKIFEKSEVDKEAGKRGPGQLVVPVGTTGGARGKDPKVRVRARDDFRMARGGSGSVDKRGAYRGRGIYTRKTDRDSESYGSRVIKNASEPGTGISKQNPDSKSKTGILTSTSYVFVISPCKCK